MPRRALGEITERMRDIDLAMLSTRAVNDAIAARPMRTTRDGDGAIYFFTWAGSRMVADIQRDPRVGLSFHGRAGLFGTRPFIVAVEGQAEVIRDKTRYAAHWNRTLDRWFEQGPNTPGVTMIRVRAERLHYWDGDEEGELLIAGTAA